MSDPTTTLEQYRAAAYAAADAVYAAVYAADAAADAAALAARTARDAYCAAAGALDVLEALAAAATTPEPKQ